MRFASCLTALGSSCFTIMPRLRGPFQRSQMWPKFQRRSGVDCVTMVTLPLAVVDGASGSQPGHSLSARRFFGPADATSAGRPPS